MIDTNTLQRT